MNTTDSGETLTVGVPLQTGKYYNMVKENRDDFSRTTTDILAKRVGYLCSNPDCRNATIGANQKEYKSTSIGIAAHITAASPGGHDIMQN